MRRPSAAALPLLLVLLPGCAAAQADAAHAVPAEHPAVRRALEHARADEARTVEEQISLCEIPAPPFAEAERAAEFRDRLEALGLERVRIDAEGNVIGERPGVGDEPLVVLSGHLDTVFPEGTDVTVTRQGTVLRGPGIGDDCRGLAVVLAVARALEEAEVTTAGTVLFVGTVGEEGLGNLRGVRHLFTEELADREVGAFVSVDGTGLGIVRDAVGSHRYRVTFRGPGGHSYGDFGAPSPVHALGRAIAKVSAFDVPSEPRTTFNVGIVEGGTAVNAIAAEAAMVVDMRSLDDAALGALDDRFQAAVGEALAEENARGGASAEPLTVEIDTIGVRPAGTQAPDAPVVAAAVAAGRALGFDPPVGAASTDANLPISLGIPSVTIDGGGSGGGAHSPDEWYDTADSHLGTQWALLYVVSLAGVR